MYFVSLPRLPYLAAGIYASSSRMFFRNFALFFVIVDCLLILATGQTTHTVTVGQVGSFYDPATLVTETNDTVTFMFLGPFHTVTQSSLDNPCVPLAGGFDSGVLGRGINGTGGTPTWSITITNISEPIWYFCEISTPTSHCESGMVGVINPPNPTIFSQFQSAAKAVTGTPAPSPTLVLGGIGASASQGPVTITLPASATVTSNATKSHLGTIIGAAVGGALGGILVIAAITWWLLQRKARREVNSPTSDDTNFFRYDPGPVRVRRPSEAFVAAKAMENSMVTAFPLPGGTASPDSTTPLAPNRRASIPPVNVVPPAALPRKTSNQTLERQSSMQSTLASPAMIERPSNVNMQALANEVAAVLMRSPSGGNLSNLTDTSASLLSPTATNIQPQAFRADKRLGLHTADHSRSSQDPPAYRADMVTPSDVLRPNRP